MTISLDRLRLVREFYYSQLLRRTLKPDGICAEIGTSFTDTILRYAPAELHVVAPTVSLSDRRIVTHKSSSHLFEDNGRRFDWVYIGNGCDFDEVLANLHSAWRSLAPGAVLAGGGHAHADVRDALKTFNRPYRRCGSSLFWILNSDGN